MIEQHLDPAHTALLVIDVQEAFDLWEVEGRRRNNPHAVVRISDLLACFRNAHAQIFHIRHQGSQPGSSFLPGSPGYQVRDEAREQAGEPVLVKQVNSAFIGTDLDARLRAAEIHTVVLCGATTNHCVETTARMAGNLGFMTILARDATWTFDRTGPDGELHAAKDIHAMTLANLHEEFASVMYTRDILQRMRP